MKFTAITILAATAALAACNSTSGRPSRVDLLQDATKATGIVKDLIDLEAAYDARTNDADRKPYRDKFARKMIAVTDQRYHGFVDSMVVQRKAFDATSDITAIALDTAAVLVTPASTKSILAGLSGLTTASKTTINKVYFYEQTLPILISQMEADRQAVLADIFAGLMLEDSKYPLRLVLSDLVRYYSAGTIDGALQEIQRQAATTAEAAEQRMRKVVDDELDTAEASRKAALRLAKDEESFQTLRGTAIAWWAGLPADEQFEHTDIIRDYAAEHGVPAPSLDPLDGSSDPNNPGGFGYLLETLDPARPTHQLLLAEIVKYSGFGPP